MTQRGNITRTLKRWKEGENVSAMHLDAQRDALERLNNGNVLNQVGLDPQPFRPVFQAQITELPTSPDFVIVRQYLVYPDATPVVGPGNIGCALPWLLRRTPFDGQTYKGTTYAYVDNQTRNATNPADPGVVYVERITPSYAVGDILHCARLVEGGVGVGDITLMLHVLDISVGRVWAADPPASP